MGVLYNILEEMRMNENRMSFASDREAKEFCEDKGISPNYIETGPDGSYIDDAGKLLRRAIKGVTHESSTQIHREKKNSYHYKGLEDLTDKQIRYLEINKAILKKGDGTYYADWSKTGKWKGNKFTCI